MDENGFMTGPSQDVENFVGQVLCVQMYDFVFQISEANQNDALNMCEDAPAPDLFRQTICTPYQRNDVHFTRVLEHTTLDDVHLDQKEMTSLRVCAVYCARHAQCVSFTVTDVPDGLRTCRLFQVYSTTYVIPKMDTSLYVIRECQ